MVMGWFGNAWAQIQTGSISPNASPASWRHIGHLLHFIACILISFECLFVVSFFQRCNCWVGLYHAVFQHTDALYFNAHRITGFQVLRGLHAHAHASRRAAGDQVAGVQGNAARDGFD